jgi:hypothetical protein
VEEDSQEVVELVQVAIENQMVLLLVVIQYLHEELAFQLYQCQYKLIQLQLELEELLEVPLHKEVVMVQIRFFQQLYLLVVVVEVVQLYLLAIL